MKYQNIKVSKQVSQVSQQQQQQHILAVLKDGGWFACNNKIIL